MGSREQQEKIEQRVAIGERRIQNILRKHGIATMRILEQKFPTLVQTLNVLTRICLPNLAFSLFKKEFYERTLQKMFSGTI